MNLVIPLLIKVFIPSLRDFLYNQSINNQSMTKSNKIIDRRRREFRHLRRQSSVKSNVKPYSIIHETINELKREVESLKKSKTTSKFNIGDYVEVSTAENGDGDNYTGTIVMISRTEKEYVYDINYDRGDVENNVSENRIRKVDKIGELMRCVRKMKKKVKRLEKNQPPNQPPPSNQIEKEEDKGVEIPLDMLSRCGLMELSRKNRLPVSQTREELLKQLKGCTIWYYYNKPEEPEKEKEPEEEPLQININIPSEMEI
jgi:hypothetical protein